MLPELLRKELATLEIKDEAQGIVEAIFATIGIVDRDGDVIMEGAIQEGQKVKLSCYGHDTITLDEAPVGIGRVSVTGNKAVFSGRYFLSTQRGQEAFRTIKEMGKDQEWSMGYKVVGSEIPDESWRKRGAAMLITKMDIYEVSPVLIGAGVGTRTLAAKEADEAARAAAAEEERKAADEVATKLAVETKAREDAEQKACAIDAVENYERIQRTLRRLKLA